MIRWPFLVPYLTRADADADVSPARRETIDIVFQSFNRYLGVAVGEHLGYLFTGGWSVLTGVALIQATNTQWWSGVADAEELALDLSPRSPSWARPRVFTS